MLKNSSTFSNYIRNITIDDGKVMVSFDITSLHMNIPPVLNNHLLHLNFQFYQQTDDIIMGRQASSTAAEIYR